MPTTAKLYAGSWWKSRPVEQSSHLALEKEKSATWDGRD